MKRGTSLGSGEMLILVKKVERRWGKKCWFLQSAQRVQGPSIQCLQLECGSMVCRTGYHEMTASHIVLVLMAVGRGLLRWVCFAAVIMDQNVSANTNTLRMAYLLTLIRSSPLPVAPRLHFPVMHNIAYQEVVGSWLQSAALQPLFCWPPTFFKIWPSE